MTEIISNGRLTVTVSDLGAELQSVKLDGTERLWQADPAVWGEHSPVLFPFVGRIKDGKYTYAGREYPAEGPHGFARTSVFTLAEKTETSLTYRLTSSESTKALYPFDFIFDVIYSLSGNTLTQTFRVENPGKEPMIYSFGAHPGFILPPDGTEFSDWYLEFAEGQPLKQELLDGMFMSGTVVPCPYAKGNKIPFYHEMFDDDAFILTGLENKTFEIKCDKSSHRIRTDCTGFDYLAFWQATGSNAKYVCIEPWNGLPSGAKDPEDLTVKRDMRTLGPGKEEFCSVSYTLD